MICNRKLKSPQSIEVGMGKTCYKKYLESNQQKRLFNVKENEDGKERT
jgi:hypothetical protein